jgi:hypothetical protein
MTEKIKCGAIVEEADPDCPGTTIMRYRHVVRGGGTERSITNDISKKQKKEGDQDMFLCFPHCHTRL